MCWSGASLRAESAPSARWCVAAAYRQFDFWVGDWDVFDVGSSIPVAHARIDPILDGLHFTGRLPGNRRTQRPKFHNLRCCQESLASELGDRSRRTLGDRGENREWRDNFERRGSRGGLAGSRHLEASERRCSRDGGHLYRWRKHMETMVRSGIPSRSSPAFATPSSLRSCESAAMGFNLSK
jgi:hypothetical protein